MSHLSNNPEPSRRRRRIAILGAGEGAWLAAAMLARVLKREHFDIQVLSGPEASRPPLAVGTLPLFRTLLTSLGIEERELIRQTHASCILGAQFSDWGKIGDNYFRGFGPVGARLDGVAFHQHWLLLRLMAQVLPYEDYSVAAVAARSGRFAPPLTDRRSPLFWYSYAYQVDSVRLASWLQHQALQLGVGERRGRVVEAHRHAASADIKCLRLEDGGELEADLYIDCNGARVGVLQRAMDLRFQDWGRWLPYDRALVSSRSQLGTPPAYGCFTAAELGWQWQITLRDSLEVGYAYSREFASDAQIETALRSACAGAAPAQLRHVQFSCGRPEKFWIGNCLFLDTCRVGPLAATDLYLLQTGLTRLLAHFPAFGAAFDAASAAEYNRLGAEEHDGIRDYAVAHFKVSVRRDSQLWRHCREMGVPATLEHRLELFRSSARLSVPVDACFTEDDWLALLLGQNLLPEAGDPLAERSDPDSTRRVFEQLAATIRTAVRAMPTNHEYLARHE